MKRMAMLLSALLAWPLLGEQLRPTQLLGLLLGFAGVVLILGLKALTAYNTQMVIVTPPVTHRANTPLGLVSEIGLRTVIGLLVGVRTSVLQVTGHVMKGKASTAVMLLGILPIYVAVVLGMVVFHAPIKDLQLALYLGLALPFVAVEPILKSLTGANFLDELLRGLLVA